MDKSKLEFMQQVGDLERTGKFNKAKLGGYIYDLVQKKVDEVREEMNQKIGSGALGEGFGVQLKEFSSALMEAQSSIDGLTNKVSALEQKLDVFTKLSAEKAVSMEKDAQKKQASKASSGLKLKDE